MYPQTAALATREPLGWNFADEQVAFLRLQEVGLGPHRPTWADSLLLPRFLSRLRRLASTPRKRGSCRRPRRFVTWLAVSLADRDLVCQDRPCLFRAGAAPRLVLH